MLNFQSPTRSRRVPNYLARSTQRRLLGLVLTMALAIWLFSWAANPENFTWINQLAEKSKDTTIIDTQIDPHTGRPLIMVVGTPPGPRSEESGVPTHHTPLPGVDESLFASVADDTPLRKVEMPAASQVFKLLDEMSERELADVAASPVKYVQLFSQPDSYRGEMVTMKGTVRGVYPMFLPLEDDDRQHGYQVWFKPKERDDAFVVNCLELPPGFPIGERLKEPASVTGVFFKRWTYRDKADLEQTVPLLLARTIQWKPVPVANKTPWYNDSRNLGYLVGGAALVAVFAVWLVLRGGRSRATKFVLPSGAQPFDSLRNLEVAPDVRQALSQLETEPADGEDGRSRS